MKLSRKSRVIVPQQVFCIGCIHFCEISPFLPNKLHLYLQLVAQNIIWIQTSLFVKGSPITQCSSHGSASNNSTKINQFATGNYLSQLFRGKLPRNP